MITIIATPVIDYRKEFDTIYPCVLSNKGRGNGYVCISISFAALQINIPLPVTMNRKIKNHRSN